MTLFCANNMTSNIQHWVTAHYPSVSGVATAKSLESMEIGMGCTIGVPRTSQWRGFTVSRSGIVQNGWSQGVWRAEVPKLSSGRSQETEAKCENRVQIFTFFCTKFLNFINTGAELGQYFLCAHK